MKGDLKVTEYQVFFEELKACYKSHGLLMNARFLSPGTPNPTGSYLGGSIKSKNSGHFSNKTPHLAKFGPPCSYKNSAMNNKKTALKGKKSDLRVFSNLPDMLYLLALELSQKIGRLPDALHARMVLTTDQNPSVKAYIRQFGA